MKKINIPYKKGSDNWKAWLEGYNACLDDFKETAKQIFQKVGEK